MFKNNQTKKAFTLTEIMIVIIVIATLAVLVIPRYQTTVEHLRSREGVNILIALFGAEREYFIDNNSFTEDISDLGIDIPTSVNFDPPTWCAAPGVCVFSGGSIRSKNAGYTLYINQDTAGITCSGGPICKKMGYAVQVL